MRRTFALLSLLVGLASCGGEPPTGSTEQASSLPIQVGGPFHYYNSVSPINEFWHRVHMPYLPTSPSQYASFSEGVNITNGISGGDNGVGFHVNFIRAAGGVPAHFSAGIWANVVDAVSPLLHSTYRNVSTIQIQPKGWAEFYWDNVTGDTWLWAEDTGGAVVDHVLANVRFTLGTQPNSLKDSVVNFSVNKESAFRCETDMPGADIGANGYGTMDVYTQYSNASPFNFLNAPMLASGPTTCFAKGINMTGYDHVEWSTGAGL